MKTFQQECSEASCLFVLLLTRQVGALATSAFYKVSANRLCCGCSVGTRACVQCHLRIVAATFFSGSSPADVLPISIGASLNRPCVAELRRSFPATRPPRFDAMFCCATVAFFPLRFSRRTSNRFAHSARREKRHSRRYRIASETRTHRTTASLSRRKRGARTPMNLAHPLSVQLHRERSTCHHSGTHGLPDRGFAGSAVRCGPPVLELGCVRSNADDLCLGDARRTLILFTPLMLESSRSVSTCCAGSLLLLLHGLTM